jgi:hypothetical protein
MSRMGTLDFYRYLFHPPIIGLMILTHFILLVDPFYCNCILLGAGAELFEVLCQTIQYPKNGIGFN